MAKAVACVVVSSARAFSWLGHMPILNWTMTQLADVRGLARVACVVSPELRAQAVKLLRADAGVDVVVRPASVPDADTDRWLTSAAGPAADADVVVAVRPVNPFLPAAKIEACLRKVVRGACSTCVPARDTAAVSRNVRLRGAKAPVDGVRVFRVAAPREEAVVHTVPVSLVESLDVSAHDQFIVAAALADSPHM